MAKFSFPARSLRYNSTISIPTPIVPASTALPLNPIVKFGSYPFAAAAATILISKEFIQLNEEYLLAGNLCLAFFLLYTYFGDAVGKAFDEERSVKAMKLNNMFSCVIMACDAAIDEIKSIKYVPDVLASMKTEFEQVNKLTVEAEYWRVRHAHREVTVKKLAEIAAAESRERTLKTQKESGDAAVWVVEQYKSNADLRNEALEHAIWDFETPNKTRVSPTSMLFIEFLENQAANAKKKAP